MLPVYIKEKKREKESIYYSNKPDYRDCIRYIFYFILYIMNKEAV